MDQQLTTHSRALSYLYQRALDAPYSLNALHTLIRISAAGGNTENMPDLQVSSHTSAYTKLVDTGLLTKYHTESTTGGHKRINLRITTLGTEFTAYLCGLKKHPPHGIF